MGGGKGGSPTVGYKYYLGVQMALCHGPVDLIRKIKVDGREAWTGWAESSGARPVTSVEVDAPELFGGDGREGGVSGTVDLEWGFADQGRNAYLQSQLGTDIPAYRGVFCAVLNRCYMGDNPYLKPWSFDVQRIHLHEDGTEQWYDEKAPIGELIGDNIAVYFALDFSGSMDEITPGGNGSTRLANQKTAMFAVLEYLKDLLSYGHLKNLDIKVVGYGCQTDDFRWPSPTKYGATASDINAIKTWYNNLTLLSAYRYTYFPMGVTDAPDFFSGADPEARRISIFLTDGTPTFSTGNLGTDEEKLTIAGDARAILDTVSDLVMHAFNIDLDNPTYTNFMDNTMDDNQEDGDVPVLFGGDSQGIKDAIIAALFGRFDMNPAHIIRECLTEPGWGMGYQDADIDSASFTAAADTLFSELMGISILWHSQGPIEDFVAEILRHIDGVLYVDRTTGKFVLKLIRDDYDINNLVTLDESNVLQIKNHIRPTIGELTNSVTVNFYDHTKSDTGTVTVSDQALIQVQGATIGTTIQYPGFTNHNIAGIAAQRDLKALSTPLLKCDIVANREAMALNVGDAFILDWPDLDIDSVVMRVDSMGLGDGRKNAVTISVVEDVFSLGSGYTSPISKPDTPWVDPASLLPAPADPRLITEAPYYELVQNSSQLNIDTILADESDAGFLLAAAGRTANEVNAQIYVDSGAGYSGFSSLDFCAYAYLAADAWYTDATIYYTGGVDLDLVDVGTIAQIGDELVRVDAFGEDSTGTYITVGRGILDTVPAEHIIDSTGTPILFWDTYNAGDEVQYTASDALNVKLRTVRGSNILPLDDAPVDPVTMDSRAIRPYPPGDLRVDGKTYTRLDADPAIVFDRTNVITWAHRDRLQQTGGYFYDYTDTDIGPEASTQYTVQFEALTAAMATLGDFGEVTGITGTSFEIDSSTDGDVSAEPAGTEYVKIKVLSSRGGYESWQPAYTVVIGSSSTVAYWDDATADLSNPSWSTGDGTGWAVSVGTPRYSSSAGGSGEDGYFNGASSSRNVWLYQDIAIPANAALIDLDAYVGKSHTDRDVGGIMGEFLDSGLSHVGYACCMFEYVNTGSVTWGDSVGFIESGFTAAPSLARVPAGAETLRIWAGAHRGNSGTANNGRVDDVRLKWYINGSALGSGQLLTNPSFESGDFTGWTTVSGTPQVTVGAAPLAPDGGSYAFGWESFATAEIYQEVDVTSIVGDYTHEFLDAWLYGNDYEDQARIKLQCIDVSGAVLAEAKRFGPANVDSTGSYANIAALIPAGTVKLRVYARCSRFVGTANSCAIDDITLELITIVGEASS
ncbi:MAG TPA: phage tail protein [Gammaproteobacteria bacterium]|nr:phage tail protein [Gammaproteobacteria bacterium]